MRVGKIFLFSRSITHQTFYGERAVADNGFGIGAVSNVETASRFGLGKFRSSATASKFRLSLIAPNAMIVEVARALASEMKIVKKLIAESDSKN